MTDASDDGVAGCLFVVKKADARDVTMADLKDHTISTLISINSKILDDGQRTWNTYEAEILAAVRMVQKHGSYITIATAKFPTSGPDFKAKIGFLSDSTTAIGRWKALTIPIGDIGHLSAKSRRFFSWSDICAGTRYWHFTINHLSGNDISLPHMLSHLGNLAKTKARELKAVGMERTVAPMFIHSYHNGHQRDTTGVDELGYSFNSLTLSTTDVTEMKRAYLADTSTHLGVPLSTIYNIIALDESEGLDGTLVKKSTIVERHSVLRTHTTRH